MSTLDPLDSVIKVIGFFFREVILQKWKLSFSVYLQLELKILMLKFSSSQRLVLILIHCFVAHHHIVTPSHCLISFVLQSDVVLHCIICLLYWLLDPSCGIEGAVRAKRLKRNLCQRRVFISLTCPLYTKGWILVANMLQSC